MPGGQTGASGGSGLRAERFPDLRRTASRCIASAKRTGVCYLRPKAGLPPGATGRGALRVAVRARASGILAEYPAGAAGRIWRQADQISHRAPKNIMTDENTMVP